MLTSIVIAALFALAPATEKPADPNVADQKRMQGDWMVTSIVTGGMKLPDDEAQTLFRTVAGERFTISRYSKVINRGRFTIDATQQPKTIDSIPDGPADTTKPILGIYEFDGPRLRICNASPGKPRPKNFEAPFGSGQSTVVWEPEKK